MGATSTARFPVLRLLGGILFVLAGLLAYCKVALGASGALVFFFGGAVVLVAVLAGHRSRPGDVALFMLGVLVLSGVAAGYAPGGQQASYSAARDQVHASTISLNVKDSIGSVDVSFTDRVNVAYEVNFTRPVAFFSFWPVGADTVTNSTGGGVLNLDVVAGGSSVTVAIGRGYSVDVNVTTDTGSVSFEATGNESVRDVSLMSSTGSVSAIIDSASVESIKLHSSTGSVSLSSDHLGAVGTSVPVTLSSSIGSVSMSVGVGPADAVSVSASTNLGTINHQLPGFTVTQDTDRSLAASIGNPATATRSFAVTATTNLGSVSLSIHLL